MRERKGRGERDDVKQSEWKRSPWYLHVLGKNTICYTGVPVGVDARYAGVLVGADGSSTLYHSLLENVSQPRLDLNW